MGEIHPEETEAAKDLLYKEGHESRIDEPGLAQIIDIMREIIEQYPEFYGPDAMAAQAYEGSAASEGKPEGDKVMERLWSAQDRAKLSGAPAETVLFGGIHSRQSVHADAVIRHGILDNLYEKLAKLGAIDSIFAGSYEGMEKMARALADDQQVDLVSSVPRTYKREPIALIDAQEREKGVQFGIGSNVTAEFLFPGIGREHDAGGMNFVRVYVLPEDQAATA